MLYALLPLSLVAVLDAVFRTVGSGREVPHPVPHPAAPPQAAAPRKAGGTVSFREPMAIGGSLEAQSAPDEALLLRALQAGEAWAHESFVRTHAGRIKALAERYLHNEEDANDVVQETFLSAFKAVNRFEGKAQLGTWLHRIAVNAALMKLRSKQRRSECQTEEDVSEHLPRFIGLGVHDRSPLAFAEQPEEEIMRGETCVFVRGCIERLPEMYRTVLLLRDIEELENEEVAERLGVTVNAAKIRVHRARQALRALLEPRLGVQS